MGKLSELIKKSAKTRTLIYDVNAYLFCKMGYGDINLAGQNARYRAFNSLKKEYAGKIGKSSFKQYEGDNKPRAWVCWLQGIDNAPEIVKACCESIKYHIKDMEIVFLNKDNIKQYITLPQYIYDKWESGIIPNAQFADIIRLQLLIEHGGIWIDSTVFLTDKLPDYITDGDLFVFRDGFYECEVINMGSWLIYSKPNNILLNETQHLLLEYWKKHNYLKNYFIMHLFFRMVTDYYPEEWIRVPYFNQMNCHTFMMELNEQYSEKRFNQLKSLTCIHKLTHKIDCINDGSYCSRLTELYK